MAAAAVVCAAPAEPLPVPPVPLTSLMVEAEALSGTFYQALWRSSDMEIERADLPRWRQSDFAGAGPGFVTLRSHEANASSLLQASSRELLRRREEVATRIWDQRLLTTGTQAYGYLRRVSRAIGEADAAMNSLGTGVVSLPTQSSVPARSTAAIDGSAGAPRVVSLPEQPLEFRYGYIVLADTAFFSLRQTNVFDLTLRRFRLLTSTLQPSNLGSAPTFLSFAKPIGLGLPTPTVTYAVHSPSIELALAQSFSPLADFSVSGTHDFVQNTQRVSFSFGYRF